MVPVSQLQTAAIFPVWHYRGHKTGWQLKFRLSHESAFHWDSEGVEGCDFCLSDTSVFLLLGVLSEDCLLYSGLLSIVTSLLSVLYVYKDKNTFPNVGNIENTRATRVVNTKYSSGGTGVMWQVHQCLCFFTTTALKMSKVNSFLKPLRPNKFLRSPSYS